MTMRSSRTFATIIAVAVLIPQAASDLARPACREKEAELATAAEIVRELERHMSELHAVLASARLSMAEKARQVAACPSTSPNAATLGMGVRPNRRRIDSEMPNRVVGAGTPYPYVALLRLHPKHFFDGVNSGCA
jgi:hypothetical protein